MDRKPNRLIYEQSPYLLQHAYNPVEWFPWNEEAFISAKNSEKPIFLSIGYSTCHWCHVMEKESFEDEEVAKLMNDAFISIKVDREERPDIDGIYMSACQMITGSGGWPLTVVMTPDKKPFFVGTYFPKHNRFNRIGMLELIPKLKEIWHNRKEDVIQSANEITLSLNKQYQFLDLTIINESILEKAFNDLSGNFDKIYGGFGKAPKFPSPHTLSFLLSYYSLFKKPEALMMVEKTLIKMRSGGIYDHIGYGFARYSTDQQWLVPHFEKMLYDQAMLLMVYSETYSITKNEFYKKTASEIIEYILRDMTHADGGFYSAEDADSEGEEGKFYLWYASELRDILGKELSDFACDFFNVSENGNWVDESTGIRNGTNILHLNDSSDNQSTETKISPQELEQKVDFTRKKLFEYREKRIHPLKDDKILTDWNSLMISALARSYKVFRKKEYLNAAENSYKFISKYLQDERGKLKHRFRGGTSGLQAHLDDYAFFINASLDLYVSTFNIEYLDNAIKLNKILIEEFWDNDHGGFFFSSVYNEILITRQKEVYDGAIPSGNSVALLNLIRLSGLTGNKEYEEKISQMIKYFSGYISRSPSSFAMFMQGLVLYFNPAKQIVIRCKQIDENIEEALLLIRNIPNMNYTIIVKNDNNSDRIELLIPFTKSMHLVNNNPTFYVCQNYVCNLPVNSIEDLRKLLSD